MKHENFEFPPPFTLLFNAKMARNYITESKATFIL